MSDAGLAPLKKRSTFPRSLSEAVLPPNMAKSQALHTNMGVEYVLVFTYPAKKDERAKAADEFEQVVRQLAGVGLATEVRANDAHSLLVFIKVASDEHMFAEIYRSRVRDWIYGVRSAEPAKDTRASLEQDPLTDGERLRIVYQLITNDAKDGGAGIKPGTKAWPHVDHLFALHDHTFNKHWIQKWSTAWHLKIEDLDEIRDKFGEKVAYYFAFEQTYFTFLLYPSVGGLLAWSLLGSFSPVYAVFVCFWCVVFVEWWKHRERDLALRWGVRGVSSIESRRHDFHPTQQVEDPATGELVGTFPATQRLQRQLLQVPFGLLAAAVLGSLIVLCFAIEIFIGEVYDGPGKSVLTYLPTVILSTCSPLLTGVLTTVAKRLNAYENYETDSQYDTALTGKLFVLDFVTSYLGIILTAFVYVPFGKVLVPYLDVFNVATRRLTRESKAGIAKVPSPASYSIKPDRLRKQVIYFAVTASIINFALEVVVPYLKRQGFVKIREMRASHQKNASSGSAPAGADDHPEEKEFLARVRSEAELAQYDVHTDLREMVIQFGYLSLFSIVWPLVPVSFLVNNWFELRADAFKICLEMQRPTPARADSIGSWLAALEFLTWFGSLTLAALAYLFSNDGVGPDGSPYDVKAWGLLLSIFLSEQIYLVAHRVVAYAISKIDSPGRQKERRDRFLIREQFYQDSLQKLGVRPAAHHGQEVDGAAGLSGGDEKQSLLDEDVTITRESLEEDQRQASLQGSSPERRFWQRQQGWRESAKMGRAYIAQAEGEPAEVAQAKKEL